MKALLIIDMQKVSFTPKTPRYDTEGVIERINLLADNFRGIGDHVIFIQHDGTKEGVCIPGTEEWEILEALKKDSTDLIISKTANDAFYKTDLKHKLTQLGVDELVITGCATDFCVDATVKSALVCDFNITIIADGHTTADRPHLAAKRVTEFYNWIWSEMTPTHGRIKVTKLDDYLKNQKNEY
jgi:nicotinamidase-related amidase